MEALQALETAYPETSFLLRCTYEGSRAYSHSPFVVWLDGPSAGRVVQVLQGSLAAPHRFGRRAAAPWALEVKQHNLVVFQYATLPCAALGVVRALEAGGEGLLDPDAGTRLEEAMQEGLARGSGPSPREEVMVTLLIDAAGLTESVTSLEEALATEECPGAEDVVKALLIGAAEVGVERLVSAGMLLGNPTAQGTQARTLPS